MAKLNAKELPVMKKVIAGLNKKFPTATATPKFTAFFDGYWKVGCWDKDLYFENKKFSIMKQIIRKNPKLKSKISFFYQVRDSFAHLRTEKKWGDKKVLIIK